MGKAECTNLLLLFGEGTVLAGLTCLEESEHAGDSVATESHSLGDFDDESINIASMK